MDASLRNSYPLDEWSDNDIYQEFVAECPQPKSDSFKAYWAATQMICEAAEVLELFEKEYRKGKPVDIDKVRDELGDVMWGITAVCNAVDLTLDEVIENNINKLSERHGLAKEVEDRTT